MHPRCFEKPDEILEFSDKNLENDELYQSSNIAQLQKMASEQSDSELIVLSAVRGHHIYKVSGIRYQVSLFNVGSH